MAKSSGFLGLFPGSCSVLSGGAGGVCAFLTLMGGALALTGYYFNISMDTSNMTLLATISESPVEVGLGLKYCC